MQFHEIATIFPLMDGNELIALVADIKENGLLEPIITHEGKIVDGRNRYRACELAEVEPRFEEWKSKGVSLIAWIVSKNLHRRHLTSSQAAACSLKAIPYFEEEARKRQLQELKQYRNEDTVPEIFPEREKGEAREQAAKAFNTNPRYIQDAKLIQERKPELLDKLMSGELTIPQAKR